MRQSINYQSFPRYGYKKIKNYRAAALARRTRLFLSGYYAEELCRHLVCMHARLLDTCVRPLLRTVCFIIRQ